MKYVITAVSRLTGERTVISKPYDKDTALRVIEEQKRRQHSHSAYSRLQLREAVEQLALDF